MAVDRFDWTNGRWEIDKDPDSTLVYVLDLTDVVTASGNTLTAATVTVTGVTKLADSVSGSTVRMTISGGDLGSYGKARVHYTIGPEQDDTTLWFRIVEK